jgi:hypothetical protein
VETFLHFTDISDMREKSLHITGIRVFVEKWVLHIHETREIQNLDTFKFNIRTRFVPSTTECFPKLSVEYDIQTMKYLFDV